ncbi:Mrx10p Ecym_4743 [Eremothecium cymbalariae DBVPG|uniref:DUF155 domain-containing protein n=1 Tax=Eremothecium cymbalariae (strain CBS 270.75 / DBVPG 7215 / KCTC 17166 / NRRL Y-17582) TaxID=931890 RepID=G8JSN8_ERECY|nr:hypothetical protein Ecym_4743 [Eremothecium cymbalariae DBVPG\
MLSYIRTTYKINLNTVRSISSSRSPLPGSRSLRRSLLPGKSSYPESYNKPLAYKVSKFLKLKPVTSITTSEAYDLPKVIDLLNQKGYQPVNLIPDEIVTFKYFHDGHQGDVMIIRQNGTVVAWGLDESSQMENILPLVDEARINPLKEKQYESEDLDYVELDTTESWTQLHDITNRGEANESFVEGDLIVINSISANHGMLDKAALSGGLSRSTRLSVLEAALESHIAKTKKFTELLSSGKKLNFTENHILESTGRLFLIRGNLNLYSELIETPDLYWSEPDLEKLYEKISRNLDIQPRITILNKKLDYATDESRALLSVLNEKKSTKLEWIIIWLISVEVCFELFHFYEKYKTITEDEAKQESYI